MSRGLFVVTALAGVLAPLAGQETRLTSMTQNFFAMPPRVAAADCRVETVITNGLIFFAAQANMDYFLLASPDLERWFVSSHTRTFSAHAGSIGLPLEWPPAGQVFYRVVTP